jgi:hypothetical protein
MSIMPALITLVHSPLVGPATWETLAAAIGDRGHQVMVPDLTPIVASGPPFARRLVEVVAESVGQRPAVLVGHSGAGPLLGAIADAMHHVRGCVFVDAGLPTPGLSWFETAPAELADHLRGMVRDGWLPPWSEWWGPEALADLVPDAEVRARFTAGCLPLPLGLFEEALPKAPGWRQRAGAYLRLSEAYQEPAEQARALGWPVVELASHHLAVLAEPELVVGPLLDLVVELQE